MGTHLAGQVRLCKAGLLLSGLVVAMAANRGRLVRGGRGHCGAMPALVVICLLVIVSHQGPLKCGELVVALGPREEQRGRVKRKLLPHCRAWAGVHPLGNKCKRL